MPVYGSLSELFAKDRPDGVVLATPNQMHVDQALECVAAGVPTLVEKPVAHTLEAGMRLCAAVEAANVPVLVGHHRRHSSIMAKAVEVIASGMLGKIVAVVGTVLFYKAENEGYYDGASAWRREPGGGPILLNMIHEVGNLRSLCGEIVAVQAFTSNATRNFPVEDTAAIALRFANGALGTFMLSDTAASDRSWEHTSGEDPRYAKAHTDEDDCYIVAGTFGSLAIPTMRLQRYSTAADQSWHKALQKSVVELAVVDPLERQIAHFADVIRGKAKPLVSARDGLQNLRVVDAIVEAAKSGCVVIHDLNPLPRPTDDTRQDMKICMLGSGALGSALGGVLTEGGNDVWLIDAWAGHVDAMASRGLTLRVDGVDRTVKVKASTSTDGIGPADLVVVLVKSYHTREAIEKASRDHRPRHRGHVAAERPRPRGNPGRRGRQAPSARGQDLRRRRAARPRARDRGHEGQVHVHRRARRPDHRARDEDRRDASPEPACRPRSAPTSWARCGTSC